MPASTSSQHSLLRSAAAVVALSATLFLGACASKALPPDDAIATARAAITQADAAVRAEQYAQARRLAEQAEADGVLAERKARAERSRRAAVELDRANAALRQEAGKRTRP